MIHIIGGGLAGLAAALAAAEAGQRVIVHEAGPVCGGRCRSYFDRELGCRIDNGNHLLLSGNDAAMGYLRRIGAAGSLTGPASPVFPFYDVKTGARWTVRPNRGPLPWWVFAKSRRVPGSRVRDYVALLRLRSAAPSATVAGVLPHNALYKNLIEPLAVSALNTPAAEGSAQLLWAVVAGSLARGGGYCVPRFPKEGLSESFVDPAIARIAALGGEVRTGQRISAVHVSANRVSAFTTASGVTLLDQDDQLVLAVPASVAPALIPGIAAPDAFEAIINLHFKADAPFGEAGFIGLIGGVAEWVFVKPGVISITISAANRLLDVPGEQLAASIWPEICAALDLPASPAPPWRLLREKRATFAATPAQQMRRISATSALQNMALAGDWTNTSLPATIEGAIKSGFVATHQMLSAAGIERASFLKKTEGRLARSKKLF